MSYLTTKTIKNQFSVAIKATNDQEAIFAWLASKTSRSPNTFESYHKEATRLITWLQEQGLTLNSLRMEDVHRFYALLQNPPGRWLKPLKPSKNQILLSTQLLTKPLSNKSVEYTKRVLSQLYAFLLNAGYLRNNPFAISATPPVQKTVEIDRYLDIHAWTWFWRWVTEIHHYKTISQYHRTRWLFALLYNTGIRRSSVVSARMYDFQRRNGDWILRIAAKGNKRQSVIVNSFLLEELKLYRTSLGLHELPDSNDTMPVIASIQKKRTASPLSARLISTMIREVADRASSDCKDLHLKNQVMHMTTHWLRHTNATHLLLAGASLETTQDALGHADPKTTRIYAHTISSKRREDAEKLATFHQTLVNQQA